MTPAQEIDGYRNDVAYNHDYHRELAPEALKLLTLARGWAFPSARPLRYLELGYGNGVSLNIHAAATPSFGWPVACMVHGSCTRSAPTASSPATRHRRNSGAT